MLKSSFTLICLFALCGIAIAADTAPPADVFANAGFKITLSAGTTATKQDGPDFVVYHVNWGTEGHLGLYEGCCAQTFLAGPDLEKSEITINGLKAHEVTRKAGDVFSRELHIAVPNPGTSSTFVVHAWYKSLTADDAKIADQMIATIAPK